MTYLRRTHLPRLGGLLLVLLLVACQEATVSYKKDVVPIFQSRCFSCHDANGEGFKASGFNMETYTSVMKGTRLGPVIVPGQSISSTLMLLVEGKADPKINMPHGSNQPTLTIEQIQTLKDWINQGALNN